MGFLHMPRVSRKMQRTLRNLRVSLLCFLLTFLVLRNTIGAGKFGTPAQDFEEIRQHLHYVGLHRRHFRVLAEAVEEEHKQREAAMLTLQRRSPWPEEGVRRMNVPLHVLEEERGNALIVRQGSAPLLTSRALQRGLLKENVGFQKDLEGSRIKSWDVQQEAKEASAQGSYGASRVLLLAGVQSSECKNPAGEHLILKSIKNKVDYTTLHGLEISISFSSADPEMSKPLSKLSLLQRTMVKYPRVEWLWWMPYGAFISDMAFVLPIENYTDFNLVLLSSDDKSHHHTSLINLNTDTFLIRNCQWSLDTLRACAHMDMDQPSRLLSPYFIKGPQLGARDQCALISHSNQNVGDFAKKIYVQHSAVLSGNWRDVAEKVIRRSRGGIVDEKLPFVTHFLGCNACQKGGNEACAKEMARAIDFAEKQSMQSSVAAQELGLKLASAH